MNRTCGHSVGCEGSRSSEATPDVLGSRDSRCHMNLYKDFSAEEGDAYSRARPAYPSALFDVLKERCPGRDLAWDCATGNGQAAIGLADWIGTVVATDASRGQLENRKLASNLHYAIARAERPPLPDKSA